ncbi:DUF1579 domain-containing protein [Roseateles chitinivorans]|uniref:DUF1579 domain-containing protein n=1 Tax=Roseateles chitinivorans TaxID=2917965 RepID=UPI003D67D6B4
MHTPAHPGADDFDFEFGTYAIHHRRLNRRLSGCEDWTTFEGRCTTRPILGGLGNLEDNTLDLPDGRYRAVALRSFDPASGLWAIWWLDGRAPHALDVPVKGRFDGPIGLFFADDVLDGRDIKVRFTWDRRNLDEPRWEQAFSADGGTTWETNWVMRFTRVADAT